MSYCIVKYKQKNDRVTICNVAASYRQTHMCVLCRPMRFRLNSYANLPNFYYKQTNITSEWDVYFINCMKMVKIMVQITETTNGGALMCSNGVWLSVNHLSISEYIVRNKYRLTYDIFS